MPGLSFRRVPDASGDTCICLILFLKDAETTKKAMHAMQAEGVPAGGIYDQKVRDWHIYAYWDHILEKKNVAADGLPWSAVPADELPRYAKDMCPRTLDLLSRAIMIDINWHYSDEDCGTSPRHQQGAAGHAEVTGHQRATRDRKETTFSEAVSTRSLPQAFCRHRTTSHSQ